MQPKQFTHQVVRHRVHVGRDFLPPALQAGDIGLAAHDAVDSDVLGHPLHLVTEDGQPVDHVVDGLLEHEYLALSLNFNLLAHVTVGNRLRDGRDVAHLEQRVSSNGTPGPFFFFFFS